MNAMCLLKLIMDEIGIEATSDGYILDQDNYNNRLGYLGKVFRVSTDPNKFINLKKDEVIFNPLNNIGIMKSLFEFYLDKCENLEGRYFPVHFPFNEQDKLNTMNVRDGGGVLTKSKPYYNLILCYCDLILRIADKPYDLSVLDNQEFKII